MLDPQRHARPISFFLATNRREIPWLLLSVLSFAVATSSMIIATYVIGRVVDALQQTGSVPLSLLVSIIGLFLIYEYGFRIGHFNMVFATMRIRSAIKRRLFEHTISLSFGYFADRFAGEIAHKISKTADAMERMVKLVFDVFVEQGVLLVVSALILASVHPYLGLGVACWGVLFILGLIPIMRRTGIRAGERALEDARTGGSLVDTYSNIAAVKVYGRHKSRQRVFSQIETEARAYRSLGLWEVLTYHYIGLSIAVLGAGFISITALVYQDGLVSVGDLVFITGAALRLLTNVWEFGRGGPEFVRERGEVMQNLKDLVVVTSIADGSHSGGERVEKVGIEYHRVTFGYTADKKILDDFSIRVGPKEKVGIVGLSGAGKTTFVNLLLRFFDVEKGSIFVNEMNIKELSQEYLRSHISYISQETSLFHATIAENIAYGSETASRHAIERVAQLAYADEFIKDLPQGYESVVGERGIKLSGGQRQRIAIARALLADRPLFILDEATSSLDSDSEEKIKKGLESLMKGKTVIAIAHRLSTLSHMDRIIYMEDGKIVEEGTPVELLKKNGRYAKLWHMQAQGFLPSEL